MSIKEGSVMANIGDRRYRRIVWVVRLLNLFLIPVVAVILLANLSFETRFALMNAYVAVCFAGFGYLILALRRLRRQTGGPDGLWVPAELRQFQHDVLFRWRRLG